MVKNILKSRNKNTSVRKYKTLFLLTCFFYIFFSVSLAAKTKETGNWNIYPSYNSITEIEPAGSMVFALANNLFSYNVNSGAVTTYNKATTLSDAGITHIAWSDNSNKLIIAYNNANIDLLSKDGNVVNIPDLYLWSSAGDKLINHIYVYGKYAYLSTGFGIVKLNTNDNNIQDSYQLGFSVNYSYIKENYLYAASATKGLYRCKLTENLLNKNNWELCGSYSPNEDNRTNVYDKTTGTWWTTTEEGKLTYYTLNADNERIYKTEGILPEGPASDHFYRLYLHNGVLYSVGGFYAQEKDGEFPGEVHVFDGKTWTEFEQPTKEQLGHRNVDWLSMAFDPQKEGHVMVGAKSGLYEFQDGKFIICYNRDNSPLTSCINSSNYILSSDLMYDDSGRLWLFNSSVDKCLWTIDSNNNWNALDISSQIKYNDDLRNLFISKTNGKMWFLSNYWEKTQLYCYDFVNSKLASYGPSYTNEDGTSITPYYLYRIAEDRNGNIWMCTSSGPLYVSASSIQSGSAEFIQHKIPRNDGTNYADYLLANVDTRSIAIDGGNRKWLGTQNDGVYLISDDNNTQIEHFTTENSPLLSNSILDILVEPQTGKVYFATTNGLCSYMSHATEPSEEMTKDNIYAYPNPVRPDYMGDITIVGLTYNADVKIVTSNGVLINQGKSTGGTYFWNGCDSNGKKVASGIYMVETATSNGEKGVVCKIAIIK